MRSLLWSRPAPGQQRRKSIHTIQWWEFYFLILDSNGQNHEPFASWKFGVYINRNNIDHKLYRDDAILHKYQTTRSLCHSIQEAIIKYIAYAIHQPLTL
jgi:hypothetical protein